MSYRFNSFDIIVGVGLCATVFGAMLIFFAAAGTFVVGGQETMATDRLLATTESDWLQPALGRAIVERAQLQQRTDHITASAMSEWSRAMQAYRGLLPTMDRPLSAVMHRAVAVPEAHDARVQAVMGRSIVNFTQRGIRSGVLSADLYLSDYNQGMIGATELRGQRMDDEFAASWQTLLGTWIVNASRDHLRRVGGVQEQLGTAILHLTQARTLLEDAWADNQYQLGSLMAALDRSGVMHEGAIQIASEPASQAMTPSSPTLVIPEISMAYLVSAAFLLCTIFFGGLLLSAASRESNALAEARRNAGRWVYRMAS
jgi:hypothetical protein